MAEPITGWSVKVYHAVASPALLLLCGVPQTFFIVNLLAAGLIFMTGNMLYGELWWRWLLVHGLLHGLAMLGTAYEMQWLDMSWRYLRYATRYEG